jgi:hypothetical protein
VVLRRAPSRAAGLVAAACALTLWPATARADGEAWLWYEHRVALAGEPGSVPRASVRVMSDTRFNGRSDGLAFQLVRVGPILHAAPWYFVATHGAAVALRKPDGGFAQQFRWELDLNPHSRIGDFTWIDRNRFETVWTNGEPFYRYRNLLRVAYAPKGASWIPFAWNEVFVRFDGAGVNENRAVLGVGRVLGPAARVDVSYMLRSRDAEPAWVHDHMLLVHVFFGIPPPSKVAPEHAPHETPDTPRGPS